MSIRSTKTLWLVCVLVGLAGWGDRCPAAEIALRPTATPSGTIVRLGDIAEVRGAAEPSLQDLAKLPIMPAPVPGTKHFLSVREIRDMLRASGIALESHRFTGASQVTVGGGLPESLKRRVGRMTATQLQDVEDDLAEAIAQQLSKLAMPDEMWQVAVKIDEEQLRQLAEAPVPWLIDDIREPWVGPQKVTITYQTTGGTGRMSVEADVSLPDPVVVLTRPVARGVTLGRADLALARPKEGQASYRSEDPLHSMEDVVGMVVRRPLREGQVLTASMIEQPTLVRRGDIVSVVALAYGIRIETQARARQSGTDGELIQVETLDTRETFAAQISGVRKVQVIGR